MTVVARPDQAVAAQAASLETTRRDTLRAAGRTHPACSAYSAYSGYRGYTAQALVCCVLALRWVAAPREERMGVTAWGHPRRKTAATPERGQAAIHSLPARSRAGHAPSSPTRRSDEPHRAGASADNTRRL